MWYNIVGVYPFAAWFGKSTYFYHALLWYNVAGVHPFFRFRKMLGKNADKFVIQ